MNRVIFFVCGKDCVKISSEDGQKIRAQSELSSYSTQEKADNRIILHALHMASTSEDSTTIAVRSPDTDVFVLLLKSAQQIKQFILFDTGNQ